MRILGRLLTIIFFLFVVIWAVYLVWFYGWSSLTPSYHGIGVTDFGVEIDGPSSPCPPAFPKPAS